jgi:hypothetical protein
MKLYNFLQKRARYKAFFDHYETTSDNKRRIHFKDIRIDEITGNLIPREGEYFWLDKLILEEDTSGYFSALTPGAVVHFDADTEVFVKNISLVCKW